MSTKRKPTVSPIKRSRCAFRGCDQFTTELLDFGSGLKFEFCKTHQDFSSALEHLRSSQVSMVDYDAKKEEKLKDEFKEKIKSKLEEPAKELKLVAYTSISPSHKNIQNQLVAVNKINELGISLLSFNHESELAELKKDYPDFIKFIESTRTSERMFGKPCVMISEMIDHFIKSDSDLMMIINSDVVLSCDKEFIDKIKSISEICVPIAHRNDYSEAISNSKEYSFGFDVFFISKAYAKIFPQSLYSMGQTWWDYWIPYTCIKSGVDVAIIKNKFAFHKEHKVQYKSEDWTKMTQYFMWENNIKEVDLQRVNDKTREEIIKKSNQVTL